MLTSNYLQEIDFADKTNLKQLYNYDLVNARENLSMEKEVRQDFLYCKNSSNTVMTDLIRQTEKRLKYSN